MTPTRLLLSLPLLLALVAALSAACGGDDAPTDEEYFQQMDATDKEVDERFGSLCETEEVTGRQCATEFADAASFALTEYEGITPAEDAKDEHEELVAAIGEFRDNAETASEDLPEDAPAEEFFTSGALDDTRVNDAFCAIQAIADEKQIEADVGCGEPDEESVDPSTLPAEATTEVLIQDFAFDPPHIEVQVGDTVTWTQGTDEEPHTATADDETFDSGVLEEGDTFPFTFTEAGEFSYFCEIHPEMLGLVTVTE
jgi:plastocyanin